MILQNLLDIKGMFYLQIEVVYLISNLVNVLNFILFTIIILLL